MLAPDARGPISDLVLGWLVEERAPDLGPVMRACAAPCDDPIYDDDRQLALWVLYELHYGGFTDVDERWEWSPECLRVRALLEDDFEAALRCRVATTAAQFCDVDGAGDLARRFFDVVASISSPPLTAYLQRRAAREEMLEFLVHRTIYHLKEADPHAWALPRLTGPAKVTLAELLYDEYGGGRPERLHAAMFKQTLEACGLDSTYGAYIEQVPAVVLAVNNAMSMFGLHRRLRAAAMGHLAAFEATSSLPAHRIARGLRRLDFPAVAAAYYEEHVEADAVHEQLAVRAICGALIDEDPRLLTDVAFGAAACLHLDDLAAAYLLDSWSRGRSALRSSGELACLSEA